jgi:hypothetical protein
VEALKTEKEKLYQNSKENRRTSKNVYVNLISSI